LASRITPWLAIIALVGPAVGVWLTWGRDAALTAVVIILTVYLVLIEPQRRVEQRKLFWSYLADAVYEACHNLQHIAKHDSTGERTNRLPDFHLRAAQRLVDAPFNDLMLERAPELWPHVDHMIRNDVQLQRYPFTAEGARDAEPLLLLFVEHCLRFIIAAGRADVNTVGPDVGKVIDKLGHTKLRQVTLSPPETRYHVGSTRERACRGITVKKHEYGLKGDEKPVYWFGDEDDDYAMVHGFRDLGDPPPRPGFAESVIAV
jgi:hypothetical protein